MKRMMFNIEDELVMAIEAGKTYLFTNINN